MVSIVSMKTGVLKYLALVLLLAGGCTSNNVYEYMGLKPATGQPESVDGVFQDFESDADVLAGTWADPEAKSHDAKDRAWVVAEVKREESQPYMRIEFARNGYGASFELAPKDKTPEMIPSADGFLSFEMRAADPMCVGVRLMEHDGEVWAFGKPPLEYQRMCVDGSDNWKKFEVSLAEDQWFKFVYAGNTLKGNDKFDRKLIAMLTFEIGNAGRYYFAQGEGTADFRQIRVDDNS